MKIARFVESRLGPVFCLVAAAFLAGACQQPATAGSSQPVSFQQKTVDGHDGQSKRRCCRRASPNGNH